MIPRQKTKKEQYYDIDLTDLSRHTESVVSEIFNNCTPTKVVIEPVMGNPIIKFGDSIEVGFDRETSGWYISLNGNIVHAEWLREYEKG